MLSSLFNDNVYQLKYASNYCVLIIILTTTTKRLLQQTRCVKPWRKTEDIGVEVDNAEFFILNWRQCFYPRLLRTHAHWHVCQLTWRHYWQTALDNTRCLCFHNKAHTTHATAVFHHYLSVCELACMFVCESACVLACELACVLVCGICMVPKKLLEDCRSAIFRCLFWRPTKYDSTCHIKRHTFVSIAAIKIRQANSFCQCFHCHLFQSVNCVTVSRVKSV